MRTLNTNGIVLTLLITLSASAHADLIGYWTFNEAGDVQDFSGAGNHGQPQGAISSTVGRFGGALHLSPPLGRAPLPPKGGGSIAPDSLGSN